jgi:hypothetical protein
MAIVYDKYGLIVQHDPQDVKYKDGGDTCRSEGLMALAGDYRSSFDLPLFVDEAGLGRRHPFQQQNNNDDPRNFTRDQMLCLMAGLWANMPQHKIAKRLFWSHAKRLFFCQNTHDQKGNKKPWYRGRDPLFLHHIGFMIKAARVKPLYWFVPLTYPFMLIELLVNVYITPNREPNQLLAMLSTLGTGWLKLYCRLHPDWKKPLTTYWGNDTTFRYQAEIGNKLVTYIENRISDGK